MTTHPDKRPVAPGSEVSPKLDGIHAVARKSGITTKSGKPIDRADLRRRLKLHFLLHPKSELKGELYKHGQPFDKNLSDFKKNEKLPFHVFPGQKHRPLPIFGVKRVRGETVRNGKDADAHYQKSLKDGYEGQIVRSPDGKEAKRKPHSDTEHEIVDAKPGKTQGSLTVRDGAKTFKVPVTREVAEQRPVGKKATIVTKGRHKTFKAVRDYEMSAVQHNPALRPQMAQARTGRAAVKAVLRSEPYLRGYGFSSMCRPVPFEPRRPLPLHLASRSSEGLRQSTPLTPILLTMPSSDQISRSEPSVGQRAKRRLRNAAIGAAGVGLVGGKVYKGGANWKQAAVLGGVIGGLAPPRDSVLVQGRKSRPSPFRFSAYIGDVKVKDLPPETRELVGKFIKVKPNYLVARYGMVLADLIPKSDPANLSQARGHVSGLDEDDTRSDFEKRRDGKFILVLNDRVIDGHHFIATAEKAGVTSSLNVLDLTPVRFQQLSAKDRLIKWVGAHPKTATGIAAGAGGYVIGRRKRRQSVDINVIGAPTGEQKVQLSGLGHSIHTSSQMLRRQESHDPAPTAPQRPMTRRKKSVRQPIPLMVDHRGAPANWEFGVESDKDKRNASIRRALVGGAVGVGSGYIASGSDSEWQTAQKLRRMADPSGNASLNEREIAARKLKDVLRKANKKQALRMAGHGAAGAVAVGGIAVARRAIKQRRAAKHEFADKDQRKLRNARDAALTAGGVATVGAAGVVGYKALKAGRKVAHQVKEGVAQTVQNSAGAAQDVRDLIKNQVAPTMEKTKQAAHVYGSALDAVRPVVDSAGPIVKKGAVRAARTIRAPGNVVKGYKVGMRNPNRKSRAYQAGKASKDILPNPKRLKADAVEAFKEGMDGGYHIPGRTSKSYKTGKLLAKSRLIRKVMKRVGLADGRTLIQLADVEIDPHRKLKKWAKRAVMGTVSSAALFKGARLVGTKRGRKTLREIGEVLHKNSDRGQLEAMRRSVKAKMPIIKKRAADKAVAQARAEWTAQAMPKPPTEPGFVDAAKNALKRAKKKAVNKVANIGNDELGLSALDRELFFAEEKPSRKKIAAQAAAGGLLVAVGAKPAMGLRSVYHGTSQANRDGILREGLLPKHGGSDHGGSARAGKQGHPKEQVEQFRRDSRGRIHVSGHRFVADSFADLHDKPATVKATISERDWERMKPDNAGGAGGVKEAAATSGKRLHPDQIHGSKSPLKAKAVRRIKDMRRGMGTTNQKVGMLYVGVGGALAAKAAHSARKRKEQSLSSLDRELLLWSDNGDYEDPRFQHVKARRQLTAEEHAQIKQDRRKLLVGTAAGGTGALALAGYLGQDTKKGAKIKKDINREVVARYKAAPKGRKLKAAWNGAKRLFSSLDSEILFYTPTQATDKKGRRADPVGAAVTGRRVYVGNTNAAGERVYERIPILHHQVVDSTLKKARGLQKWAGRAGNLVKDTAQTIVGKPRQKDSYGRTRKREWEKAWFKNAAGTAVVGGAGLAVLRHARANSNGRIAKGLRAGRKLIHKASKIFNSAKLDNEILLGDTAPDWDVRDQRGKSARVFAPGSRPRLRREKEWHEKSDNERKLWKAATAGALITGAGVTSVLYRGRLLKVPRKVPTQVKKVKGQKPPAPVAPTVQHSRHNGMNQPHQ